MPGAGFDAHARSWLAIDIIWLSVWIAVLAIWKARWVVIIVAISRADVDVGVLERALADPARRPACGAPLAAVGTEQAVAFGGQVVGRGHRDELDLAEPCLPAR